MDTAEPPQEKAALHNLFAQVVRSGLSLSSSSSNSRSSWPCCQDAALVTLSHSYITAYTTVQSLASSPHLQGSSAITEPVTHLSFPTALSVQKFCSSLVSDPQLCKARLCLRPIHKWFYSLVALSSLCMDANTSGLVRTTGSCEEGVCQCPHSAQHRDWLGR